jgi:GTP-binding protein HflX
VFERPSGGNRAVIVALDFVDGERDYRLQEIGDLALSAGADVVGRVSGRRARPDPALFAGKGKVAEIDALRRESGADLVIFDHALSGVQQRNLERALECRVVDRASLNLVILALGARSAEGKLLVELAQLAHLATRLVGVWTDVVRKKC